jgi:alcohol dehydrogenase class IV
MTSPERVPGFTYRSLPMNVVFGQGAVHGLRAEVKRLGCSRVLLVTGPGLEEPVASLRAELGDLVAAEFTDAVVHTPTHITDRAVAVFASAGCDGVVSLGGGSATGLSKALAARTDAPQVVVPTTYAGSEVTPVLGETTDGVKTTRSGPEILPETVVYDVDLTLGLPVPLSVVSAVNAMAHAVEALYSPDANPVTDQHAVESVRLLADGLRRISDDPRNLRARSELLQGAWLAGICLATAGMGLHHKLCHTVGASLDLPHAETHTVILPHAMHYNAAAAPVVMERIGGILGGAYAPAAVHDLVKGLNGPVSLHELGVAESDLPALAEAAVTRPYPNPAPVTDEGIRALLVAAWRGDRPHPSA